MKIERFFEGMVEFSPHAKAELMAINALEEDLASPPDIVVADLHGLARQYRELIVQPQCSRQTADIFLDDAFEATVENNVGRLESEDHIGMFARTCAAAITGSFARMIDRKTPDWNERSLMVLAGRRILLKGSRYTQYCEGSEVHPTLISNIYTKMLAREFNLGFIKADLDKYVRNEVVEDEQVVI